MSELRWQDCDREPDPIKRLDCRTSHLNDGFHLLQAQMHRMEKKVSAGLVMQACAGLGGLAALLNALHNMGII